MRTFQEVVASHHAESQALLVAASEPCISVAYDERTHVRGRSFEVIEPGALATLPLRDSWLMAVILCPGDDTQALAEWAKSGPYDPHRIIFYFHKDTNAHEALEAWMREGLQVHSVWTVRTWRDFHRHFGAAWNVRVFDDFR